MSEPHSRHKVAVRLARVFLCLTGLVFLSFGAAAFVGQAESAASTIALVVPGLLGFGFLFVGLLRPPSVVVEFTTELLERLE